MVEFNTVLSFIQAAGIIVGVAYYIMNIQNNQRNQQLQLETRQAQLLMAIYDKIETRENTELLLEILDRTFNSAQEYHDKYGPETNPKAYHDWLYYGSMLQGLGVLVIEGFVDIRIVTLLMGSAVTRFWETYEVVIKEFREKQQWSSLFSELEYLYKEVVEFCRKHPELKIK